VAPHHFNVDPDTDTAFTFNAKKICPKDKTMGLDLYYFNADPDPVSNINAKPCGSGPASLDKTHNNY
jgi:hypothetical protein